MPYDIGPQYDKDNVTDKTGFLAKARLHQSKYRALKLNLSYDTHGNYLTKKDAISGHNFFDDFHIFHEVKKRYPEYSRPLYANMLRSEHISFNLFVPFKSNLEFAKKVFNNILINQIQSIDRIEIEFAPSPSFKYLNDRTSFDAYIEYTHKDNERGIIGIEVKYTEGAYKLKKGSKEEFDINDSNSKYYIISDKCGLYKPKDIKILRTDKFRQIWRNQLLGESILINDFDKFKHFTSMIIFPKGNKHFVASTKEYVELLINNNYSFLYITYEDFFSICSRFIPNDRLKKWLDYLKERYIFK